jgi:N-acetylglucosamine-6-sulfatase
MIRILLACATLALSATRPAAAADERPNIIFIITDDQRWDCMSAAGHPFLKTPNMDRIAREGAMFINAFVTTPLCSPARASFLTGQYVHTNGIKGNKPIYNEPSHELVTFPRLLREAGYESAYVGKWHMGNDDSARPGFDRWVSFRGQGRYDNPTLNIDGKREDKKGYVTDILTDYAVEFINASHEKPFVLYMGHKAVHGPFKPAPRHAKLFADEPLPQRPNVRADITGKPAIRREVDGKPMYNPNGVGDESIRNQLRCLVSVDESIGRILDALDEKKLSDNTLVIFTSDNGYFWNEHYMGDKRAAYEESIRVPLVMRYPKLIKPGTKPAEMVLNVDIAPTLLELGKAKSPQPMHGVSLIPLLSGKGTIGRTAALFEYFHEQQFPRVPTWTAVRTDRWKYIHYPDFPGMNELYDLQADPYEMANLIDLPEAAEAKKKAVAQMEDLLEATK